MLVCLIHSGLLAFSRKKSFCFGLILHPLLTTLVRLRCVDAGLELEVHKIAKIKKNLENIQPSLSIMHILALKFMFKGTNVISFVFSKPFQVCKLYVAPNKTQYFFNQMRS